MCSFTSVFCQRKCVLFVRNLVKGSFQVWLWFYLIPTSQKCRTEMPMVSAVLIFMVSCDSRRSSASVPVCSAALNSFCLLHLCLAYFLLLPLPISLRSCCSLFTYLHELPSFFPFGVDITAF